MASYTWEFFPTWQSAGPSAAKYNPLVKIEQAVSECLWPKSPHHFEPCHRNPQVARAVHRKTKSMTWCRSACRQACSLPAVAPSCCTGRVETGIWASEVNDWPAQGQIQEHITTQSIYNPFCLYSNCPLLNGLKVIYSSLKLNYCPVLSVKVGTPLCNWTMFFAYNN